MPNVTKMMPSENNQLQFTFDTGEQFQISYLDLRFECPCATCVDEITGKRTLKRESLRQDVKPKSVEPVGRYGVRILWSDGHSTGMYHFDRIYEIAKRPPTGYTALH